MGPQDGMERAAKKVPSSHNADRDIVQPECGVCIGWYDWVALEDDVAGLGGDVPAAEMNPIMEGIAKDLEVKLHSRTAVASKTLAELHRLLADLIGEP